MDFSFEWFRTINKSEKNCRIWSTWINFRIWIRENETFISPHFFVEVLRSKDGEIRVQRQKGQGKIDPDNFVPCPSCNRWVLKQSVVKHHKTCRCKEAGSSVSLKQAVYMRFEKTELSQTSIEVLSGLNDGPISSAIKSDSTLIDYVNYRSEWIHDIKDQKKLGQIRQNLRLLGRFLVEAQRSKPETSMIGILFRLGSWQYCRDCKQVTH